MASEASHVWDDTCIASLLRAHGVGLRCKVCHQVFYCLDADSIGEDIIADGEPEELGRLFEVLKRWVVVKVLGTIGPGVEEHGQYLKRYIVCIKDQGFEWLEDPKHLAAIIRNRSKIGAKPQSSPGSKDFGRCDPGVSDELAELEAKLCTSKTQASKSTYPVAIRHAVLRLSVMMSKLRLARLARYLVGHGRCSRSLGWQ